MMRMTVFPSDPLEQQIHGTELREQNVHINVERLLEDLRPDDKRSGPLRFIAFLADIPENRAVLCPPVLRRKSGMIQYDCCICFTGQLFCQFLCPADSIYDDPGASAVCQDRFEHGEHSLFIYMTNKDLF